jgi:hypothetical protein
MFSRSLNVRRKAISGAESSSYAREQAVSALWLMRIALFHLALHLH